LRREQAPVVVDRYRQLMALRSRSDAVRLRLTDSFRAKRGIVRGLVSCDSGLDSPMIALRHRRRLARMIFAHASLRLTSCDEYRIRLSRSPREAVARDRHSDGAPRPES